MAFLFFVAYSEKKMVELESNELHYQLNPPNAVFAIPKVQLIKILNIPIRSFKGPALSFDVLNTPANDKLPLLL